MKYFLLIWISIGFLLICGCSQTTSRESKHFTEIVGKKSLTKVVFVDGRNGKRENLSKKDKIQAFHLLLNERQYKEMYNHDKTKGYIYNANLYYGNKQINVTFLREEIIINNIYYLMDKPISEEDIADLLK
ncbi:hypothetical protein [Bacillus sp. FJAT-49736]|uniref:hypothetical protein n=1 Tax=Bacillus sp. FJAT-49736 TaxID=2833582 RepID=UPI001BCA39A5|nr:hypothetical protein [Bacillus sp. FJAT-49736]MBS4174006.1 hypothetical protein [Bacillus sp. FJAT-49736]